MDDALSILLLSDIPPSPEFPAGLFLDHACRALSPEPVSGVFVTRTEVLASLSRGGGAPGGRHLVLERPREQIARCGRSAALGKLSYALLMRRNGRTVSRLVRETADFAREDPPDLLWGMLAGQTQIRLVPRVAEELGVPLVTMVFDPPEYELTARGADAASRRILMDLFARTLARSRCCVTVSDPMAERLTREYGVPTAVCFPSLPESLALPPGGAPQEEGRLILGLCGRIYAADAWAALLDALDSRDWRIAGRSVEIRVLSRHAIPRDPGAPRVRNLGWTDQAGVLRELSQCDLLYCPYWLDPRMEAVTRYSFPSKLTTYLASGRPVLFHGPADSSVWEFLNGTERCGFCTDSRNPAELADVLGELASREDLRRQLAEAGSRLFSARLTGARFRRGIREAFGVPDDTGGAGSE